MVQMSKMSFWGLLCSNQNTFSRTAGVRRARACERPSCVHMGGEAVPMSYRTPNLDHDHPRSDVRYIYYYIDVCNFALFRVAHANLPVFALKYQQICMHNPVYTTLHFRSRFTIFSYQFFLLHYFMYSTNEKFMYHLYCLWVFWAEKLAFSPPAK